ncbi:MAG: UTP--glucose-1-phosphate uridylyltransferase GalU [Planctomycetota bacterium]
MIRKAVIPAAGFGTRFLPATKAQPKEMLPIVDVPTIQLVVEEAVEAGIDDILIIIGRGKQAIMNHFDRTFELEAELERSGKKPQLREIRRIAEMAHIHYIRQMELKGLGDAVLHARQHVGDEPFVVLLGDVIIDAVVPCTRQLIDVFSRVKAPVIGVEQVPREKISRYGVVSGRKVAPRTWKLDDLVEKPAPDKAPSDLAIASRYILTPEIFAFIEKTKPGSGGEIQLTDALRLQLKAGQALYAYQFEGKRHDIGNKLEYLKTQVEYGLKRPDIAPEFKAYLKGLFKNKGL